MTTPTTVVLASTNEGKARELLQMFALPGLRIVSQRQLVPADFHVEESGSTFESNAWLKALAVCAATGLPALADDSGLEVDALDGRPGVRSARYAGAQASDGENNALLLRELADVPLSDRTARFVCALVFAAPGEAGPVRIGAARGTVEGRIVLSPRGSGGFGYDPLFEAAARPGRTTAELSQLEKNAISHRGQAAEGLSPVIRNWLTRSSS